VPDWRQQVVSAVEAWLAIEGRGQSRPDWKPIGRAQPTDEHGWFVIDVRGRWAEPDELDDLRLSSQPPSGTGDSYRVLEAIKEGDVLRVHAGAFMTADDLQLWALKQPRSFLLVNLRDRLDGLTDPGLATELAHRRLARLPPTPPESSLPGLRQGQRQAYAACWSAGLHLVWGPPGTGKTQVLARAITDLVDAGKRVLLVSSTNIAVDTALLQVIQARRHARGDLVRVGTPHLRAVAQDDDVALPRLVAARFQQIEEQRRDIERRLAEHRSNKQRLAQLEAGLAEYDHDAYLRAAARLMAETRIAPLAERTAELTMEDQRARSRVTLAERAFLHATSSWEAIAEARQQLDQATRLEREVEDLGLAIARMQTELQKIDAENLETARALERLQTVRGQRVATFGERRRLRRVLDTGRRHRSMMDEQYHAARKAAELQSQLLRRRIDEHCRRADPIDADEVANRYVALQQANTALDAARNDLETTDSALAQSQDELLTAEAARPSEHERRLVVEAERAARPSQHAEWQQLKQQVLTQEQDQRVLMQTHERLLDQMEEHRRSAEAEIITAARLVATTLARSRIHPAIAKASPFDVVLVDEVSPAHTPEVLLAVAKARETAVLLGDFLQLGPVLPPRLESLNRADVQDWLLEDCFSLCGVRTAADAKAHDGCVVLDEQFRFGPDVMELANRATYQGALQPGTSRPRHEDDPEIVLVDTDGIDDLDIVRRSRPIAGWWLAGSLLARALAQHHRAAGAQVGVVTPYSDQVDATLEALRDVEPDPTLSTEVGTVHRFQGREFDVVIFDLVEDGRGRISSARLDGRRFDRDGARLFNVGLTRTRHRLYLIASGQAVTQARTGTVLSHVRSMIAEGLVGTVRAVEHLTPVSAGPPADQTPSERILSRRSHSTCASVTSPTNMGISKPCASGWNRHGTASGYGHRGRRTVYVRCYPFYETRDSAASTSSPSSAASGTRSCGGQRTRPGSSSFRSWPLERSATTTCIRRS
jgi:hypothetical protein